MIFLTAVRTEQLSMGALGECSFVRPVPHVSAGLVGRLAALESSANSSRKALIVPMCLGRIDLHRQIAFVTGMTAAMRRG
jgi:hypothetical protein